MKFKHQKVVRSLCPPQSYCEADSNAETHVAHATLHLMLRKAVKASNPTCLGFQHSHGYEH